MGFEPTIHLWTSDFESDRWPRNPRKNITSSGVDHSFDHSHSAAPDLAAVVEAWPRLPAAIRAGIIAMVRACEQ